MTRNMYILKLKNRLHLDRKTKMRVIEGIQTEIQVLLDKGLPFDACVEQIGSPKEVADDYNLTYKNEPNYRVKRISYAFSRVSVHLLVAVLMFFVTSLVGKYIFFKSGYVSTVGGVDGPTSFVEITNVISPLLIFDVFERIAIVLLVVFSFCVICWIITYIKCKGGSL